MSIDKRLPQRITPSPSDGGTQEERARFLKNIPWNLRVIKPRKCIELKTLIYVCDKIRPAHYTPNGDIHDFWEFLLIIKGKAVARSGEQEYTLTDGMMIANPPMCYHGFRETDGQELEFMIVSAEISGDEMEYFAKNPIHKLSSTELADFMQAASCLYSYYSNMGSEKALQRGIALFEAFLVGQLMTADSRDLSDTDKRYAEIIEMLNRHIEEKISLTQLSQECGMSTSLMKKIFSRNSDCGIISYFNKIKIRRAAELLDRGLNSEEIAKRLSFSSTEYFIYCFRREMGISPGKYLKRK